MNEITNLSNYWKILCYPKFFNYYFAYSLTSYYLRKINTYQNNYFLGFLIIIFGLILTLGIYDEKNLFIFNSNSIKFIWNNFWVCNFLFIILFANYTIKKSNLGFHKFFQIKS